MRSAFFIISGTLALALAGPAQSKPGNGHGNGHWNGPHFGYAHHHVHRHLLRGYGYDGIGPVGYGVGGCPPGLAKKDNGCMPPGQAKKLLRGGRLYHGPGMG